MSLAITIKGSRASSSSLPPSGNTAGDAYLITLTKEVWVWDTGSWVNMGPFVGPQGLQGTTGAAVNIKGTKASPGLLPLTGNLPGDGWIIDFNIWVWNGTVWNDVGPIRGPEGPDGGQGPVGDTGPPGPATPGPQGNPGLSVLSGARDPATPDGVNGEFWVNTVTKFIWGPKATGVWPGAGVSLVGPAGGQGIKGDAGVAGPAGADGGYNDNIGINTGFENVDGSANPTGWETFFQGGTTTTTSETNATYVKDGLRSAKTILGTTTSYQRWQTPTLAIVGGAFYYFSVWARTNTAGANKTQVELNVLWNNASGDAQYFETGVVNSTVLTASNTIDGWTKYEATVAAPATMTKGRFEINVKAVATTPVNTPVYIDSVVVKRVDLYSKTFDGDGVATTVAHSDHKHQADEEKFHITANTGASDAGKWYKMLSVRLTATGQDYSGMLQYLGYQDNSATGYRGRVYFRVQQNGAMATTDINGIAIVMPESEPQSASNFKWLVATNSGTETIAELWFQSTSANIRTSFKFWGSGAGVVTAYDSGSLLSSATTAIVNFTVEDAGTEMKSAKVGKLVLGTNKKLYFNETPDFDLIRFNETDNDYHFVSDTADEELVGNAGIAAGRIYLPGSAGSKTELQNGWLANTLLMGGSLLKATSTGVSWTGVFTLAGNAKGSVYGTSGYFEISMPANGTVITNASDATTATVASGEIPLIADQTLWYIPPINAAFGSVTANFRITDRDGTAWQVPAHWIMVVTKIATSIAAPNTRWGNGSIVDISRLLTMAASWVSFGSPYPDASYSIGDDRVVEVRGLVKSGTTTGGTTLTTFPAGFKPENQEMFLCEMGNTAICRVEVYQDGTMKLASTPMVVGTATSTFLSFSGIKFRVAS